MLFESQIHDISQWFPWNKKKAAKEEMRGRLQQLCRVQSAEDMTRYSQMICERIENMPDFQTARYVMMYYPIHHEVDLRPLMRKYKDEKVVLLPVTHRKYLEVRQYIGEEDLKVGKFHIPTPQTPTYTGKIDLFLVPGIGFDHQMMRLGRGGGYYDRFLRKHKHITKVGICNDFQYVRKVPSSFWDIRMNKIVTPTKTMEE